MVVDMRTGLPQGHLINRTHDMAYHAQRLRHSLDQLNHAMEQLSAGEWRTHLENMRQGLK